MWEKLIPDKGDLVKLVHVDSSPAIGLVLVVLGWGRRHRGNLCPAFGQRAPPVSALSQLPSAQNNPCSQETYFGVAHSGTLQGKRVVWEVFCNFK